MTNIRQQDDPVLRQQAKTVTATDFSSPQLSQVLTQMKEALDSQADGVAIAAPQIGVPWRIFMVSHRAWQYVKQAPTDNADMVFINPQIVKLSKDRKTVEEGCLSVRWWYGMIERSNKARIEAQNESGEKFTWNGTGLIAQIFQHEVDHLNGVLFIDKAKKLWESPPEQP